MKHNHRILPGHMGGQYVEGNVISVEVTSCDKQTANHTMWHFANWQLWGKAEDKLAWQGLAGFLNKEEVIAEQCRLGGLTQGAAMRDSGRIAEIGKKYGSLAMSEGGWLYKNRVEYGILGYAAGIGKPENRLSSEELSVLAKKTYAEGKGLASITPEDRKEISTRAGLITGQLHKENKTGVCGIPPEEHSKRMSNTNKQKWDCPECDYSGIAREVNKHMKEIHSLPKNSKKKSGKTTQAYRDYE
jgi:hypothetical protein